MNNTPREEELQHRIYQLGEIARKYQRRMRIANILTIIFLSVSIFFNLFVIVSYLIQLCK